MARSAAVLLLLASGRTAAASGDGARESSQTKVDQCTAEDHERMFAAGPGTDEGSFGYLTSQCGRHNWDLIHGIKQKEFSECLSQSAEISMPCSYCFARHSNYGFDHCKSECMVSWCKEKCFTCTRVHYDKLVDCVGFTTPPADPCKRARDTDDFDVTKQNFCGVDQECQPEWTSISDSAPRCQQGEFQRSDSGLAMPCSGGSAKIPVELRTGESLTIVPVPAGLTDLKLTLLSEGSADLDVRVVDSLTGRCVMGRGCAVDQEDHEQSFSGMKIMYSGEHAQISGVVAALNISVVASAGGHGSLEYYFGGLEPCPKPAPGCGLCRDYAGCPAGSAPTSCDGGPKVECAPTVEDTAAADVEDTPASDAQESPEADAEVKFEVPSVEAALRGTGAAVGLPSAAVVAAEVVLLAMVTAALVAVRRRRRSAAVGSPSVAADRSLLMGGVDSEEAVE